jgi:hypothetical protein
MPPTPRVKTVLAIGEITAAVHDHSDLEDFRADVDRALTFGEPARANAPEMQGAESRKSEGPEASLSRATSGRSSHSPSLAGLRGSLAAGLLLGFGTQGRMLTAAEAARRLRVSRATVYRLVAGWKAGARADRKPDPVPARLAHPCASSSARKTAGSTILRPA